MRTALVTALLTLATFACSGGGASIGDPAPGGGDASTTPPGSEEPDGSAPGDGGTRPDGDARPDATATDDRIDPLTVGRTWTYDVTIIGTYPLCKAGSNTGRVLGQKSVAGKNAFQVQSFCPGAGTSSYAVDGDKVEIYYANTWILSLDAPVQEGHTWTDGLYTYAWEKVGPVTVPAGTYADCWKAKPQLGTSYTTFCRGVGPVRWHYVDGTGNGYDATLTATAL
ncbi:hypothetical protein BH11MYX4_BH11MYX4_16020 [soil metagenome]